MRQSIALDPSGDVYNGTFTLDIADAAGTILSTATGKIQGNRILAGPTWTSYPTWRGNDHFLVRFTCTSPHSRPSARMIRCEGDSRDTSSLYSQVHPARHQSHCPELHQSLPPFSLLEHRGRISGTRYQTPIMAFRAGNDIIIALTYGPSTDWVHNVITAGCTIEYRRRRISLSNPRSDQALRDKPLPWLVQRALTVMNVSDFLLLERVQQAR